ncbi:ubiquitin [Flavonifractor hominis]|uniref:Ubiquitin n=1 Tax=Flavonifractor hominis TaxID=3133178 RepID=A0ABV1ESM3_9FIRM
MAITLEQVERLRERADVSYEQAKAVLEQTGGDLLDALILLERQGKIRAGQDRGAFFTTQPGAPSATPPEAAGTERTGPLVRTGFTSEAEGESSRGGIKNRLLELLAGVVDLLRHSTVNQFEVWREGEMMTSLPVLVLILLLLVAFWISLPLLVVGLMFGCKYRFSGPDLDRSRVGEVVNEVSEAMRDAAGQVRQSVQRETQRWSKRKGK